ncbi:ATP synthase complex assembly protein [Martiniozyma asiatica (nom. inval.)]|nr:ATP synthase complex assembly protein [Martiniozyma asiatica]
MLARHLRRSITKINTRNNFIRKYAVAANEEPQSSYDSNKKTETNRLEKTLARFWEKVNVTNVAGKYAIELDDKIIKTPLGYDMLLPQERKTLAFLLQNEWKNLPSLQIRPYLVPLTSLVSRVIDLDSARNSNDPEIIAKIGDLSQIKSLLLRYLDTDTFLVFAPYSDCDGELRKQQEEFYLPIKKNMEEFLSKFSDEPVNLTYMDSEDGFLGNKQPENTKAAALKYLNSLDMWQLVSLEKSTLSAKSFLTGVAILRTIDPNDSFVMSIDELSRLASLETVLQTARWGEVEDTHDVDKVDIRRNLASASLVAYKDHN